MNNRKIALLKRSTAPYYSAALTFALLCLIFTPYTLPGFLIIGAVTAAVFFAVKKLTREITVYKDRPASGVPELDDAMTALYEAIDIFTEVQPLIFSRSTEASDHLLSMKATADGMVTNLTAHPEDLKISRKFINLYLPMVVKMMKNYREMYRQGNRGDNIESSMSAIEGSLVSIDDAFRRQLDAQFANDNLDVTTDIEVLDALMGKGDVK